MKRLLAHLCGICAVAAATAQAEPITVTDVSPTTTPYGSSSGSGGRVNGLAVDPFDRSVLYAATEWGGLYKSTNGGTTWQRLDGHRPVATWDVEVNPVNPDIVYATSFYDGRSPSLSGINVSFDGGATWTRPETAVPPPGTCANPADQTELSAFGIAIERTNPGRIYIGTSCGLAISNDFGRTWLHSTPGGPGSATGAPIWDVVSSEPNVPDVCGDNGHYWISSPVWSAGTGLPSGNCSIAANPYHPTPPNLFATVGTKIYESTDGSSWTETRTNPIAQGRIPFVATNKRSGLEGQQRFDLWFGDVGLHRVTCDGAEPGYRCGVGQFPIWLPSYFCHLNNSTSCAFDSDCPGVGNYCDKSGYTWRRGGHVDAGDVVFDPSVAVDACPLAGSSDGGVYANFYDTSPSCQDPWWVPPQTSPRALLVYTMDGADPSGAGNDHLYLGTQDNGGFVQTNAKAPRHDLRELEIRQRTCRTPEVVASAIRAVAASTARSGAPAPRRRRVILPALGLSAGASLKKVSKSLFRLICSASAFGL